MLSAPLFLTIAFALIQSLTAPSLPPSVDGGWTKWEPIEECKPIKRNTPCSAGLMSVKRKCENPKPEFGGSPCTGVSLATHRSWFYKGCPEELQKPTHFTTQSFANRKLLVNWREVPYGARATAFVVILRSTEDPSKETKLTICAACNNAVIKHRQYSKVIDVYGLEGNVTVRLEAQDSRSGARATTQSQTFIVGSVDGHWSRWTYWTRCDAQCGIGNQRRLRSCNNPSPSNGGRRCAGKRFERRICDSGNFCRN